MGAEGGSPQRTSGLDDFYAPSVRATAAPVAPAAPTVPAAAPTEPVLPVGHALALTAIGLALSFALSRTAGTLAGSSAVLDDRLRRALVVTVVFYVLLGCALAAFCHVRRVRLTWLRGHVADALVLGVPLGLAGGALAVALNSSVAGHLSSDPNVELLVGGGGLLRVLLTLVVTAVLAPLVEETLFRGVLAGSLMAVGTRTAMWLSAVAFAVWHMNLVSLRYYVLMGLLLAALWRRRGLVCSMATHAAFNGVLTLAAVVATSGAGHLTHFGSVAFSMPGGWHEVAGLSSPSHLSVEGPAGAGLRLAVLPVRAGVTTEELLDAVSSDGDLEVRSGSKRLVLLPGGDAVVADLVTEGVPGHLLVLLHGSELYQLVVVTAGSPGAERDWRHILDTVRIDT